MRAAHCHCFQGALYHTGKNVPPAWSQLCLCKISLGRHGWLKAHRSMTCSKGLSCFPFFFFFLFPPIRYWSKSSRMLRCHSDTGAELELFFQPAKRKKKKNKTISRLGTEKENEKPGVRKENIEEGCIIFRSFLGLMWFSRLQKCLLNSQCSV